MLGWFRRAAPPAPAHPDRLVQASVRSRFVVTMHDGGTFEGLLVDADDRVLVLVQASSLSPQGARIGVDGALYLERREIAYLQRPDGLPAPAEAEAVS